MLMNLDSEVHELVCMDEVDETKSCCKWHKKAADQLEKMNKDCNNTAGLEAKLHLAVGARAMLRRNNDTKAGLVNGAIGTVRAITDSCITIKFDHLSETYGVEKVRCKFTVMKNYCVYRRQFPLILAFSVTVHKSQGLSLDCAIVDLSEKVFAPGMAYMAMSRVRSLSGLHLAAFHPNSIKVSSSSLEEINRLRQQYRKDLPLYSTVVSTKCCKRKLTGSFDNGDQPDAKKPKINVAESSKRKRSLSESNADGINNDFPNAKKSRNKTTQKKEQTAASKCNSAVLLKANADTNKQPDTEGAADLVKTKPTLDKVNNSDKDSDIKVTGHESGRNSDGVWPFKYHAVDEQWQQEMCNTLALDYVGPNGCIVGGPDVPLALPKDVKPTMPDGNCMFRSFSHLITGSQEQHMAVRGAIVRHMVEIGDLLLDKHVLGHNSMNAYIDKERMDKENTWGTLTEILTLSHMMNTCIFTYCTETENWIRHGPHQVDRKLDDDMTRKAMYLRHPLAHYDVVLSTHIPGGSNGSGDGSEDEDNLFLPVNERRMCTKLKLRYVKCNELTHGNRDRPLNDPPTRIQSIQADGNCLFRSMSYILTGSERQHIAVRRAVIGHMRRLERQKLSVPCAQNTVQEYVNATNMDKSTTWGTNTEITILAHLLRTRIYVHNNDIWVRFNPEVVDQAGYVGLPIEPRSVYIKSAHNHFEVVIDV